MFSYIFCRTFLFSCFNINVFEEFQYFVLASHKIPCFWRLLESLDSEADSQISFGIKLIVFFQVSLILRSFYDIVHDKFIFLDERNTQILLLKYFAHISWTSSLYIDYSFMRILFYFSFITSVILLITYANSFTC